MGLAALLSSLARRCPRIFDGSTDTDWIPRSSSESDIHRAYKRAVRYLHPDRLVGRSSSLVDEAQELLKTLTRAHAEYNECCDSDLEVGGVTAPSAALLNDSIRSVADPSELCSLLKQHTDDLDADHYTLAWAQLGRMMLCMTATERQRSIHQHQLELMAICRHSEGILGELGLRSLQIMAAGLARCGFAEHLHRHQQQDHSPVLLQVTQLIQRISQCAEAGLHADASAEDLAGLVWGFGKAEFPAADCAADTLFDAVARHLEAVELRCWKPRWIANLSYGYVKLRLAEKHEHLFDRLAVASVDRLADFSPYALSMTACTYVHKSNACPCMCSLGTLIMCAPTCTCMAGAFTSVGLSESFFDALVRAAH